MTDVSASHATLVVRRQRWHPGWKVTDTAGEPLETFPVNQVHLGVVVPAGTTRIMYRFVPPGLRPALCASFLGWSMLGMMLLASRRRR